MLGIGPIAAIRFNADYDLFMRRAGVILPSQSNN